MAHAALVSSFTERMECLGGVDPRRVRLSPAAGTATLDDLIQANSEGKSLCELVDQTLVEKAMGYEASVVAATIARILGNYVAGKQLGLVSGADGLFQLLTSSVRGPDVAFVSRQRLPGGAFPKVAYPAIAPDLAVEVLSPGNTKGEMSRKRIEYFHSGVRLVWIVDCHERSVAVYTSPSSVRVLSATEMLDGGEVLPGFQHPIAELFTDLDIGNP